jgi:hypothetical protein
MVYRCFVLLVIGLLIGAVSCQVEPYSMDAADGDGAGDSSGAGSDSDSNGGTDSQSDGSGTDSGNDTSSGGVDDTDTVNQCNLDGSRPCEDGLTCCENAGGIRYCADVTADVSNCGGCGTGCVFENAYAACEDSKCVLNACEPFFLDANDDASDGCEYFCKPTVDQSDNADRCDGVASSADPDNDSYMPKDNDCDGEYDEDVDFANDPLNCGYCGNICQFPHAVASCVNGVCTRAACQPGWYNKDADPDCEYFCSGDASAAESCNLLDDNCNGEVDEGNPEGGGDCYPEGSAGCVVGGVCVGACSFGTFTCEEGTVRCENAQLPSLEICDGIDNNCDGNVDENLSIPCGGNLSGVVDEGLCTQGVAECIAALGSGVAQWDTDNCQGEVQPSLEICDGFDNDCDGNVDEDTDSDSNDLATNDTDRVGVVCGLGECAGNTRQCVDGKVECSNGFVALPNDIACNGKDDDCDGIADERVSNQCGGSSNVVCNDTDNGCDSYSEGVCQGGVLSCSDTDEVCAGQVGPSCADTDHCDQCDGLDNDCDGLVDEDAFYGVADRSCGSPCNDGTMECDATGVMRCVNPSEPTADLCDGSTTEDCDASTPDGSGDPNYFESCDGPDAGDCEEGYWDCNGGPGLFCNEDTDDDIEVCDGVDNDCDGSIDEDLDPAGSGLVCDDCGGVETIVCAGSLGWQCKYDAAFVECADADCFSYAASESACDGKDEDCDGVADDDYQLQNNVNNCGGCGVKCADNNWPGVSAYYCSGGDCYIKACSSGLYDADQATTNGCECTPDGAEVCDGVDNDCDGSIDENATPEVCDGIDNDCDGDIDEALTAPSYICNAACPGTEAAKCNGVSGWSCDYSDQVETSGGVPVANETWCDGIDNDCDGAVDEGPGIANADLLGKGCNNDDNGNLGDGPFGVCLQQGTWACQSDETAAPVCCSASETICTSGEVDAPASLGGNESDADPNGLDEDCDGTADEGLQTCVDATSVVTFDGGSQSFEIFSYEASRPDALVDDAGTVETVPCSSTGVLPWTQVTKEDAQAACQLLGGGWDLCSAEQWQVACEMGGGSQTAYPYGDTYEAGYCIGADHPGGLAVNATESANQCVATYATYANLFDMSGNVEEWTASESSGGSGLYEIRGGSYNDQSGGLTCGFDFWAAEPTGFRMDNLGFRCCNGDDPASVSCTGGCGAADVPDDECIGDVLRMYDAGSGSCNAGTCEYEYTDLACPERNGCITVGGEATCDKDNRAELWYSVDQILVYIDIDEHDGSVTSTQVSNFGNSVGGSDPNYMPVGQNCITMLDDGSILGARLNKNTADGNYTQMRTYFYWVENPPRDGSDVEWEYLGEMANGIMLEGLYTDCAGRLYGMDTGDNDGTAANNRLIRFNDGLDELKAGTFDIDDFVQISDLATADVGDIDDLGPGIDENGNIRDNPGWAIDTGVIWDFNYETGSGTAIGSGGSWGIHVLGGDLFIDDVSRVFVLESDADLREWYYETNTTSPILYSGPTVSGNDGWSGLTGPLTECTTGFTK